MKTDSILSTYDLFCRLLTDEHLYIDPAFSFSAACRWIGASPAELNHQLETELGYSGDALIALFRSQMSARLRDAYGLSLADLPLE